MLCDLFNPRFNISEDVTITIDQTCFSCINHCRGPRKMLKAKSQTREFPTGQQLNPIWPVGCAYQLSV